MAGIFISYRRSDTEGYVGRLFEGLRARFGLDMVFFDVAGIEPGQDFHKVIGKKKAIVGKWRLIFMYSGFPVDQQTTFSPDRRVSSTGDYTFLGLRLPYAFSGTWSVKDGHLEYRVERSTITNIVPIGETFGIGPG